MLHKLSATDSVETDVFGGFCPYWTVSDGEVWVADTAAEIFKAIPEDERLVDPIAVFELLQFNYMLGDRTLVQGVRRLPWRSVLRGDGSVERRPALRHGENQLDPQEIAETLLRLLEEELRNALNGRHQVYLLLSGGLDSRIVAGVLKRIEGDVRARVTCVTWGDPQSRDVVYAQRISSWYEWEHITIPYDHNVTWANLVQGAVWGGSEVAGLHLHGMYWFERLQPDDLVIAASFGDSIGRAEFSSKHLKDLRMASLEDGNGLVHPSIVGDVLKGAERDRRSAWEGKEAAPEWVRSELHMQENYMRRMICHAMNYIRQYASLHQAFTSEPVVSFMWSLSPDSRTDEVYLNLLKGLDQRLFSLPWARTGTGMDGTVELNEGLRKEYHDWGHWLRSELIDRLKPLVFSPGLQSLGVFYAPALKRLWDNWLAHPPGKLNWAERVAQVCSLELSRRHFNLAPYRGSTYWKDTISDTLLRGAKKVQRAFR